MVVAVGAEGDGSTDPSLQLATSSPKLATKTSIPERARNGGYGGDGLGSGNWRGNGIFWLKTLSYQRLRTYLSLDGSKCEQGLSTEQEAQRFHWTGSEWVRNSLWRFICNNDIYHVGKPIHKISCISFTYIPCQTLHIIVGHELH